MDSEDSSGTVPAPRRLLALDVGNRRIGLAVTDALGYTVQPLFTLRRGTPRADLKSLLRLVRKHGIAEIVVGNPLHMSGEVSPQARRSQALAAELREASGLPVHLCDERLTSEEAHERLDQAGHARGDRRDIIDQVAAVLILESFLTERSYRAAREQLAAEDQPPAPGDEGEGGSAESKAGGSRV